jgi:hypothetical protein
VLHVEHRSYIATAGYLLPYYSFYSFAYRKVCCSLFDVPCRVTVLAGEIDRFAACQSAGKFGVHAGATMLVPRVRSVHRHVVQ